MAPANGGESTAVTKRLKPWWGKKARPTKPSLFTAANDNDIDKLKELADEEINIQTVVDSRKNTPLHYAAYVGAYEAVVTLAGYVIDVDDVNEDGYTPFLFAVWAGHCNICTFLLDKQANVNHLNKSQEHAVHIAARDEHCAIVDLVMSRNCDLETTRTKTGKTALHCACATPDNMQMLQLLLMWCSNLIFIKDMYGNSPLHVAVQSQSVSMVRLLLMKQASPNSTNDYGCTPLMMALKDPSMRAIAGVFGCADVLTRLHTMSQAKVVDHLKGVGRTVSPRSHSRRVDARPESWTPKKTLACGTHYRSFPALLSLHRSDAHLPSQHPVIRVHGATRQPTGARVEDIDDTMKDDVLALGSPSSAAARSVRFSRQHSTSSVLTTRPERRTKMESCVSANAFIGDVRDVLPLTRNHSLPSSPSRRTRPEPLVQAGTYPTYFPRAGGGFLASNPIGVGFLSSVEIPTQCISTRHDMRRPRVTAHMKRAMQTHDLVNSVGNAETRKQIRAFQTLVEAESQFDEEYQTQTQHIEELQLLAQRMDADAASQSRASTLAGAISEAQASAQRAKTYLLTARHALVSSVDSPELRDLCGVDFLWDEVDVTRAEKNRSTSPCSKRNSGSPERSPRYRQSGRRDPGSRPSSR